MTTRHPTFAILVLATFTAIAFFATFSMVSEAQGPPATERAATPAFVAGFGMSPPLEAPFPVEYRGDTISVSVAAHVSTDGEVSGLFEIRHTDPDGRLRAELRGEINCLRVEGRYAVMTGVVIHADTPDLPNGELHEGTVAGIVVEDGEAGDSMVWAFDDKGSSCTELPAKTAVALKAGAFVVSN